MSHKIMDVKNTPSYNFTGLFYLYALEFQKRRFHTLTEVSEPGEEELGALHVYPFGKDR